LGEHIRCTLSGSKYLKDEEDPRDPKRGKENGKEVEYVRINLWAITSNTKKSMVNGFGEKKLAKEGKKKSNDEKKLTGNHRQFFKRQVETNKQEFDTCELEEVWYSGSVGGQQPGTRAHERIRGRAESIKLAREISTWE